MHNIYLYVQFLLLVISTPVISSTNLKYSCYSFCSRYIALYVIVHYKKTLKNTKKEQGGAVRT